MKKNKFLLFVAVVIFATCTFLTLIGCGLGNSNSGGKTEKTITISIEENAETGTLVLLTKTANFSPFYQDNIKYEIVGENSCEAKFSHVLDKKNNWFDTYVKAEKPGQISIKLTYFDNDKIVAESNIVSISFYSNSISTVDELKAIANTGKGYILEANIDLSNESNWIPIEGFTGLLNGNGYKILNLTINSTNDKNIGLFDTLEGSVTNLTIENAQITSRGDAGNAGILAGTNNGKISNVIVEGNISPKYYNNVGGIAGYNNEGTIINSINRASVSGTNNVGGIVGYAILNANVQLDGNQNLGIVEGKEAVGGIGGYITTSNKEGTYYLEDLENNNSVTGKDKVGGIFGYVRGVSYSSYPTKYTNFEVSVLTNNAEILGSGDYIGGLIGYGVRLSTVTSCDNTADITGGHYVGGFIGYSADTTIKANDSENNNTISGKGYVGGFAGYVGLVENAVNNGTIKSNGIIVEDGKSMAYVGGIAGYCTGLIGCINNSDITIDTAGSYTGGLAGFVRLNSFDIFKDNENYGVITAKSYVGGISGYLTTLNKEGTYSLQNNINNGVIKGDSYVGGIIGAIYGVSYSSYPTRYTYFEVSVFTNNSDIEATGDYVGGLVGHATRLSTISTSENKADITGENYVGGMLGYAPATNIRATGFTNENKISGKGYVGGFAGYAGIIEDAINNGIIESTAIIVENSTSMSYVGGIAGYCSGMIGCINNSDIIVKTGGQYVGGLAGFISMSNKSCVSENENNGTISGGKYTGGIVGYITTPNTEGNYSVEKNKNNKNVSGSSYVGGIAGYAFGVSYSSYPTRYSYFEVTYCENYAEITGDSYVGGIIGGYVRLKTDANLMETNTTSSGNKLGQ